ncbi:MAG: hypothetical protein Q8O25_05785 [Sulfurisoma sp.]|nr:hypothetical protein [Sulfurisoma sp.]
MRCWLRLLPLLITALWLPLQAVAAVAMPFCRHATEQAVPAEAMTHEEHCPGHAVEAAATPAAAGSDCAQDCDGCELCHLTGAGCMPAATTTAHLPAARDFVPRSVLVSPSFVPEPPQHPPRRLS